MNTSGTLKLDPNGQIVLPASVLAHYGLAPEAALRIVETHSGILLVPEQAGQMPESLAQELRESRIRAPH